MDTCAFDPNDLSLTEAIEVLRVIVKSPNVQKQNRPFTQHSVEAVIKATEET